MRGAQLLLAFPTIFLRSKTGNYSAYMVRASNCADRLGTYRIRAGGMGISADRFGNPAIDNRDFYSIAWDRSFTAGRRFGGPLRSPVGLDLV